MYETVFVFFDSLEDHEKAGKEVPTFGGLACIGSGIDEVSGKNYMSFRYENEVVRLIEDLLDRGVKVDSAVVRSYEDGKMHYKGIFPTGVRCCACGAELQYSTQFSRTGHQLCDGCLSALIERGEKDGDGKGLSG
jgi:hypothetical protein